MISIQLELEQDFDFSSRPGLIKVLNFYIQCVAVIVEHHEVFLGFSSKMNRNLSLICFPKHESAIVYNGVLLSRVKKTVLIKNVDFLLSCSFVPNFNPERCSALSSKL